MSKRSISFTASAQHNRVASQRVPGLLNISVDSMKMSHASESNQPRRRRRQQQKAESSGVLPLSQPSGRLARARQARSESNATSQTPPSQTEHPKSLNSTATSSFTPAAAPAAESDHHFSSSSFRPAHKARLLPPAVPRRKNQGGRKYKRKPKHSHAAATDEMDMILDLSDTSPVPPPITATQSLPPRLSPEPSSPLTPPPLSASASASTTGSFPFPLPHTPPRVHHVRTTSATSSAPPSPFGFPYGSYTPRGMYANSSFQHSPSPGSLPKPRFIDVGVVEADVEMSF